MDSIFARMRATRRIINYKALCLKADISYAKLMYHFRVNRELPIETVMSLFNKLSIKEYDVLKGVTLW